MAARSVSAHLETRDGVSHLTAHASRLMTLQRAFEAAVPGALSRFGRVANIKAGQVVIHAENSAVAAKIRQITARLGEVFRMRNIEVSEIQVKVQPIGNSAGTRPPHLEAALEGKAKDQLSSLAEALPSESPLKNALQRLIKTARTK